MKEENTNLETNVNVNPQPVDVNPQPVNEAPVNTAPVVETPVEMPIPVVAPTTPVEPTPVVNPVETPAPVEMPTPVETSTPVGMSTPVSDAQVQPTDSSVGIAQPNIESASMSNLSPVVEDTTNQEAPTTNQNVEEIAQGIQNGSYVNAVTDPNEMIGAKLGSSADTVTEEVKKKGKKKVVILVVVLLILAILGGCGYFAYQYEYKSADKRVNVLFNTINSYVNPLLNNFEKRIGDYDLDANVTVGTDKAQIHLNGNYAYNLEDYIYLDTSVDKIYYNQDLLDKTPIKLSLYLNDDKVYLKAEEILSKYIYIDVEGLDELMSNIKQNDVNYNAIYSSVMRAFQSSINKYCLSQTVGKATIDGKQKQANIVTITINKNNYKAIMNNMLTMLSSNDLFLTNVSNIAGVSKDEIKKSLEDGKETITKETEDFDGSIEVKVYTKVIGSELYGIDFNIVDGSDKVTMNMIPEGKEAFRIKTNYNGKDVCNLTLGISKTNSAGKTSYVTTLKGDTNFDIEGKNTTVQFDTKFTYNINLQYQEDKPVVRDAVSYENLTEEDYLEIINNATSKFGLIGTYIEDLLGLSETSEDQSEDIPLN